MALPTKNPYIGTLGMPKMWQRWFDALRNQGVTGLADQNIGERRGMFSAQPEPGQTTPVLGTSLRRARQFAPGWFNALQDADKGLR